MKDFKKSKNDLSARIDERRDINGRSCALIKIKTDLKGLNFESQGLVGDILFKEGQYLVYLAPSTRRLSIYKRGFLRLDYDISLPVQSYDVFTMVVVTENQDEGTLPVTLQVSPKDAEIKVDGTKVKNEQSVELVLGEHQLEISRKNYEYISRTINVNRQNVFFKFNMEKVPETEVIIDSEPTGAEVIIDGVSIGYTPISTFYPPGKYFIKLIKKGYIPIEEEYITVQTLKVRKKYDMQENTGFLTVKTNPKARVFVNGNLTKANRSIKLKPQVVNVLVQMPKADDLRKTVTIKRGDNITLELYPELLTGTIQVVPTPNNAQIELKGDAGEYYTSKGSNVFKEMPIGTYHLIVSKNNYKNYETKFQLKANQKVIKHPKLKKVRIWSNRAGLAIIGSLGMEQYYQPPFLESQEVLPVFTVGFRGTGGRSSFTLAVKGSFSKIKVNDTLIDGNTNNDFKYLINDSIKPTNGAVYLNYAYSIVPNVDVSVGIMGNYSRITLSELNTISLFGSNIETISKHYATAWHFGASIGMDLWLGENLIIEGRFHYYSKPEFELSSYTRRLFDLADSYTISSKNYTSVSLGVVLRIMCKR